MADGYEGLEPTLARQLKALNAVCPLRVVDGRRSPEDQQRLYDDWKAGRLNVPAVAKPGTSHHEDGTAADIDADEACTAAHAAEFGIHFPVPGEPWHAELSGRRDGTEQDGIDTTSTVNDPIGHSLKLAMGLMAAPEYHMPGTQQADNAATPNTGGGQTGSGSSAPAVQGGDWQASLTPDERWILTRESGLDPTVKNPTSSAFGIWQGLESTRKQYLGADYATTDPVKQLGAFRAYVSDRYGSAAAAKAFWEKNGYY